MFFVFITSAVMVMAQTATMTISLGLGALLLGSLPGAHAHNWLATNGRASRQASTSQPCRGRKPSDTHAQVGPGQGIDMLWATGHEGRINYIVIIKGTDYDWLSHPDLEKMITDYIDEAPEDLNMAQRDPFKRHHIKIEETTLDGFKCEDYMGLTDPKGHELYKRIVPKGASTYLSHPDKPTECQWEYVDSRTAFDDYFIYSSEKYPWIEMAARYSNEVHHPVDYDGIKLLVPGRQGAGHYVVHWRWGGYSDCVDVDFHSEPVPQDLIYGEFSGNYKYSRVDHCQYVDPTYVLSPCFEVVNGNIDQCIEHLEKWNMETDGHGYIKPWEADREEMYEKDLRVGVQVVPAVRALGAIPERLQESLARRSSGGEYTTIDGKGVNPFGDGNLPSGSNPVCGRSDWLDLTDVGVVTKKHTEKSVNWEQDWLPFVDVKPGYRCGDKTNALLWKRRLTLFDAVALCSRSDCVGLSWETDAGDDVSQVFEGEHMFWACQVEPVLQPLVWTCDDLPSAQDPNLPWADRLGRTCDDLRAHAPRPTSVDAGRALITELRDTESPWKQCFTPAGIRLFPLVGVDGMDMSDMCCGCGHPATSDGTPRKYGGKITSSTTWTYLGKKSLPESEFPFNTTIANINFQPKDSPLNAEDSAIFTYQDHGLEYGDRGNGQTYGWVCPGGSPADTDERSDFTVVTPSDEGNPTHFNYEGPYVETSALNTGMVSLPTAVCNKSDENGYFNVKWEIDLPADKTGIFRIDTLIGGREDTKSSACGFEGSQITEIPKGGERYHEVFVKVTDGKLTLDMQNNGNLYRCTGMNWLKIYHVSDGDFAQPWLPTANLPGNPWWQKELPERTAIGAVVVTPLVNYGAPNLLKPRSTCVSRWLFGGNTCPPHPVFGDFNEDYEGAIVGVSDQPCKKRGKCRGEICGRITRAKIGCHSMMDCLDAINEVQTTINCNGKMGKYVWVMLPGEDRVMAGLDIKVNRHLPKTTSAGNPVTEFTQVCYGIQARVRTETDPEFEVTADPEDPIFYSTCYARDRDVKWLANEPQTPSTRWRFNGHCLQCGDVARNPFLPGLTPPHWQLADQCKNCTDTSVCAYTTVTSSPTVDPTASPTVDPTAFPTVDPTVAPTGAPTIAPTPDPTSVPSIAPTPQPLGPIECVRRGPCFHIVGDAEIQPDGSIVVERGDNYVATARLYTRPIDVIVELRQIDNRPPGCGVVAVFPNTPERGSGYSTGLGVKGGLPDPRSRADTQEDSDVWNTIRITVDSKVVKYYQDGVLFETYLNEDFTSGRIRLGNNCRKFAYRNLRVGRRRPVLVAEARTLMTLEEEPRTLMTIEEEPRTLMTLEEEATPAPRAKPKSDAARLARAAALAEERAEARAAAALARAEAREAARAAARLARTEAAAAAAGVDTTPSEDAAVAPTVPRRREHWEGQETSPSLSDAQSSAEMLRATIRRSSTDRATAYAVAPTQS